MLNPILFTERAEQDFLRYQLTAYPFEDKNSESTSSFQRLAQWNRMSRKRKETSRRCLNEY